MKIYLAGHIQSVIKKSNWRCEWKEKLESIHSPRIKVIDPFDMNQQYYHHMEHILPEADLLVMSQVDVLVVNLNLKTPGTLMEMVYAHSGFKIPVYVVDETDDPRNSWIKYHTDKWFSSLAELIDFLEEEHG